MDASSLEKAMKIIADALQDADIDEVDKVELMINLNKFLNPEEYQNNIAILKIMKKLDVEDSFFFYVMLYF